MRRITFSLLAICVLVVSLPGSAMAQALVKREKCPAEPFLIFSNSSGAAVSVTVQIVRNGCRPKDHIFFVSRGGSSWTLFNSPSGRSTMSGRFLVGSGQELELEFDDSISGGQQSTESIKGSFDYFIEVD